MSTLAKVLLALGVVLALGLGTCVGGVLWLGKKAEKALAEATDGGGLVISSPADVTAALAGPKKAYVGTWRSKKGSVLEIDATGQMSFAKHEGGTNSTTNAPIAAFAGDDFKVRVFVEVTFHVARPPHQVGDHWEMTVDGIEFERK